MKNKNTKAFKLSFYQRLLETPWAHPKILKNGETWIEITKIDKTPGQSYPILMSDGVKYSLNGKNPDGNTLQIVYDLKPPIIGGRIVSDKTFATRFNSFLKDVQVNDWAGEEELEYLQGVAKELLDWQIATITDEEEVEYFKNLGVEI